MDSPPESIGDPSSIPDPSSSSTIPLSDLSLSSPPVTPLSSPSPPALTPSSPSSPLTPPSLPTPSQSSSNSAEKHVHFSPEVDEQLKQRQLDNHEESTEDEDILYSSNELNSDKSDKEIRDGDKEEEEEEDKSGITINVIEFCPEDIQSSTFKRLFIRVYKFSDLIKELNKYLVENLDLTVKTVETFLFLPTLDVGKIECQLSQTRLQSESKNIPDMNNCRKLFGIRVWLTKHSNPKNASRNSPEEVAVYHYVPKKRITGFSHATFFIQNDQKRISPLTNLQSTLQELEFENCDEVLAEINAELIAKPDYGRIINIETVRMPVRINEYSVNVESIEWPADIRGFVFILRVFVTKVKGQGEPQMQVEMRDFLPNMETWDSPLAIPDFESFTSVLKRSSTHLRERTDNFRILNCSTIYCPTPELSSPKIEKYKDAFIDSKRMYYSGKTIDYITKFLRIFIAKPLEQLPVPDSSSVPSSPTPSSPSPPSLSTPPTPSSPTTSVPNPFQQPDYHLNCKIFVPQSLPGSCRSLQNSFNDWFQNRDLTLISAETETVSSPHTWTSSTSLVDTSLTVSTKSTLTNRRMFFKFYVNGSIKEPPRESSPPS